MTTDRSDVDRARSELAATIEALEYKLNVPRRLTERVERLRRDNPIALASAAAGAVAATALAVWGVVRLIRR
ncbi:DUF3618 domain-containing protein [Leifsonia sp. fls2-241-R2A-40a]|uniref:DUF3618 domain-containing protein n=1 Tax=Leifsonia sp. fls2-241-R2A-40a TaxID=3040290 RepID=UPI002551B51E|nr:DUF3618 domain-containing protein [Leifsonia sp. fls2-241-R2A-40a]